MIGTRLGAYEILAELGSGGMGKVYRATATKAVAGLDSGADVAVKVIHGHLLETEGFFKRFLREAQIGKDVRHENVVRCFDCDATLLDGSSQHYLVMEYVEGQTLRDLLQELERIPEELCRHIGREVAKGLQAIHEAGAVHRDLKPENVLITPDHVVKIMDLGVARLQAEAIRLSQTGAFVGSLEYAAPEQFRSSDGEPDGRADLHALGVLLYELATGQHPFRDEDAAKVLRHVLDDTPRNVGELNPQLSPFYEEVVRTLLAKDPAERFPSADDLAAALEEGERGGWWEARARTLRAETKRPLRRIRIPRETALYGRDDDLAWMRKAYERAKAGEGQVLLIEGEAGIGKTRLVDEFIGQLRQEGEDIHFLFGSYPPGGAATASGAFSEAYREQFGAEGLEDALESYLSVTPLLIPSFAALLRGDVPPKDAEALTKDSLQTVFVHATRGLAAERTTVVLIDDLHFAPEDGRALFTSVALAASEHPILLIGTLRPGVPQEWTAGITRLDHANQRSLGRLGPKDLFSLLKDSFRSDRLAEELGLQISVKCDGNPFFAFEIIRGLREGQFIAQQPDGTWVTTKVIQDIEVPSSVLDLVNARVAGLTEKERDLLDVASCCGFEFDPTVVGDVLGLPRIDVLKRFGQVERRHRLVRSAGRDYRFDHHQVQEALYGSLNERLREEYHTSVAEAMEARSGGASREPGDLDGALAVDLCEHFLRGAQGERALRYLDAALKHLEEGYLNDQAIALSSSALAVPHLLQGDGRLAVLLRMNVHLELLGRREAQKEALAEAMELAEESGDKAAVRRVVGARGLLRNRMGDLEEARRCFEQCLTIARESGDRPGEATDTGSLGRALLSLGRHEEARTHLERHLSLAREIGDRHGEGIALGSLGSMFWSLGRYEDARAHLENGIAVATEIGDRYMAAVAAGKLGNVFLGLGRYEEARTHYEQYLAIAREVGDRQGEALATGNLGLVLWSLGRREEGQACVERNLAVARETGDRVGEAKALVNLGSHWLQLADWDRARAALEESLAISRQTGARYTEGYALQGLGDVASETGEEATAVDLAWQALALRRRIGHEDGVADSLMRLGEIHWLAGDLEEAGEALREALGLLREQSRKPQLAFVHALLASLPGGDPDAAESTLEDAGEAGNLAATRYFLWKATDKREHLAESKRLLDDRIALAPERYRESLLKDVRLHREIMEAWEKQGGGARKETHA